MSDNGVRFIESCPLNLVAKQRHVAMGSKTWEAVGCLSVSVFYERRNSNGLSRLPFVIWGLPVCYVSRNPRLDCGPYERFNDEFIVCRECGGRFDLRDWQGTPEEAPPSRLPRPDSAGRLNEAAGDHV